MKIRCICTTSIKGLFLTLKQTYDSLSDMAFNGKSELIMKMFLSPSTTIIFHGLYSNECSSVQMST